MTEENASDPVLKSALVIGIGSGTGLHSDGKRHLKNVTRYGGIELSPR